VLAQVVREHKGSQHPSPAEREDPLLHAEVIALLGDHERGLRLFEKHEEMEQAKLRRARLLRWIGRDKAAARALVEARDDSPAWLLEACWQSWERSRPKQVLALLQRSQEARGSSEGLYLAGLALWANGDRDKARKTWKHLITEHPEDPWVYRADWAWVETGSGDSLLDRHGYMGSRHPDLR